MNAFTAAGVRGYHFRLLAALEQYGPASQAELSRIAGIDKSDVVATLDDLAAWALARREPDPHDRRRNVVTVTDAGITRLRELDALVTRVQDAVLEPLDAHEQATLARLLRKLAGDSDEPGTPPSARR